MTLDVYAVALKVKDTVSLDILGTEAQKNLKAQWLYVDILGTSGQKS